MDHGEERIVYGGHDITNEVMEVLQKRRALAVLAATKRLDVAAKVGRERFHIEDKESGGYVQFQIDPVFYHAFGQKWGYGCWRDEEFIKDTLRKNPQCRVESRSRKTTVGGRGQRAEVGGQRSEGTGTNLVAGAGGLACAIGGQARFKKKY